VRGGRALVQRGIDLTLLVVIILIAWTVNAEIFHLGGIYLPQKGETRLALALTPAQLSIDRWQVGAIAIKESGVYEATLLDSVGNEVFKLKLDAATGEPQTKEQSSLTGAPLPPEEIRQRVLTLLPRLTVGEVTQKQNEPFAQATLLYEGRPVARIKVDPRTGTPLNPAAIPRKQTLPREKEFKLVAGNLVTPLGWIAALLAMVVTLYYSWKRSLTSYFKIAEAGKQQAAAALKRTLNYHCYLSLVALGIAVLHSWNQMGEVRWSLSWLTLGMMATVSVSGFFGKYLARTELICMTWRHFHVPYTVLFFLVLAIHILQKIKIL